MTEQQQPEQGATEEQIVIVGPDGATITRAVLTWAVLYRGNVPKNSIQLPSGSATNIQPIPGTGANSVGQFNSYTLGLLLGDRGS